MKSFRELVVWQKSMDLVELCYQMTATFPNAELYGLVSQIRRCAVSIPSNIAEGYGRHHSKDYVRFLQISSGSLYELQTQIEIGKRLGYVSGESFELFQANAIEIEKMLSSLISKVNEAINNR